jgi:two-component system sensor histidine kinase AtoS
VTIPALVPRLVSVRTKLVLGTVCVIGLLMVVAIGIVGHRQRLTVIEEVQRRGLVLAENLVAVSTGALVLYNFTALEQNVVQVDRRDPDVLYAIVLDLEGRVAAHSREPGLVGARLDDPLTARVQTATDPDIREVRGADGRAHYDVGVPIFVEGQRWGSVRLGLSQQRMEAQLAETRRELALLAVAVLVVGALAATLVARQIAGPVRRLAHGVTAIARGDLEQRIEPVSRDEIGRLAEAFNEMVAQLRQQRADLHDAHGELRRQFTELANLKRYTDNILGSLTSGIVTLDLDGRIVTVNRAAEHLTGCAAGEFEGRLCAVAFGDVPELRDVLLGALRSPVDGDPVSFSLLRSGGDAVPVEVVTSPLRGAEGQVVGTVGVLRDLTTVRRLEEQLRRSDRLAALGTLAAGLAHEIKNPLTSVLTFSRHLSRRFGDERFRQRFQSVVPRELERINAIVDGLLQLARPMRLKPGPVQAPQLLDQTLELYGDQTDGKRIRVVREYSAGLPTITADPEHLYQAFVNLVGNALDAMSDGGTLTVRARPVPDDPAADRGRRVGPGRIRVEIEDTGGGIPAGETGRVFDPFFTTKPGGTGLGLAITHKIVEDHGGTITIRSIPGQGTTFVVLLPVASQPLVERRGESPALAQLSGLSWPPASSAPSGSDAVSEGPLPGARETPSAETSSS